jgi:OOP family OmpA-OmpF porin
MRTKILAFSQYALLPALVAAPSAYAVPEGGYLGLRAGYSKNDHSCEPTALECDRSGSGYGIFGGYDFSPRFGVELGYSDVGDSSAVYPEIRLDGEISLLDISAKYSRPLFGESRVFAKLGASYWQGEVKGWGVKVDGSGFSPTFGVGVTFPFADRFSARLEYQYFGKVGDSEIGHTQPGFLSLGLTWHFPPRVVAVPYPDSFLPDTASAEPTHTEPTPAEPASEPENRSVEHESSMATESADAVELSTEPTTVDAAADTVATDGEAPATTVAPEPVAEPEKPAPATEDTAPDGPIIIDDHSNSPLFARGSTVLKINYALEKIAVDLLRSPNLFVRIVVHTDDEGGSAQNQQLSKARADKLADYLIWQGVNPDHIRVEGKGESSPIVKKNSESARARNRRAEFYISETRPRR